MEAIVDCLEPTSREAGLTRAVEAIRAGQSIVLPTDTVYGIGADAFSPAAVNGLLAAKGRGRHMPPPVLIAHPGDVDALVEVIPEETIPLMNRYWPGGVTIVFRADPRVDWDLGDTGGTVAIRIPDHSIARELLEKTGPLAVSSANKTGEPAAVTAQEAHAQLGDSVAVYLDAGPVGQRYDDTLGNPGSTIVDASELDRGGAWRVLRHGVVPLADIRAITQGRWEA